MVTILKCPLIPIILCIISYTLPLFLILLSIMLSPWFNIWRNALSDLGHATKSSVAPLFNFSLVLAGFLISLNTTKFLISYSKKRSLLLIIVGFTLVLVGVYDEIYGYIHSIVSTAFFIGLIIYLITYSIDYRSIKPIILVAIQVFVWTMHFNTNIPEGVAIPELVSIFSTIPFYTNEFFKIMSKQRVFNKN